MNGEAAQAWLAQGRAHLAGGRHMPAVEALQQASHAQPLNPEIYRWLAQAMEAMGQAADALSARLACEALERKSAEDLYGIGRSYARHNQWAAAGYWFQRALLLDPDMVYAYLYMGMALRETGHLAESESYSHNACLRQSLFIDEALPTQRRSVLVLCTSRNDNVPVQFLLPKQRNRQIRWAIEYGLVGPVRELPPHDLVFNVVGEADSAQASHDAVANYIADIDKPVLNLPARITLTSRDRMPGLLADIDGVCMPPAVRHRPAQGLGLPQAIERAGLAYPVTVRPVGRHGGQGLERLDTPQDAAAHPLADGDLYLSQYCDYRSPDGCFRKYRVVLVDGEPWPYHLAVGDRWVLHYVTADMTAAPWKTEEERRFLDDPEAVLGTRAWQALREIGRRLGLDYCGVDFAVLPDGRLLVFEANATMLVHPEEEGDAALRFKNPYVQRIVDAFDRMLERRQAQARGRPLAPAA